MRRELLEQVAGGALHLTTAAVLPLAEAAEAHRLLESRRAIGKILLTVGPEPDS